MTSFLQTKEWLEFQKEAGHKVWNFDSGKIRANIIKLNLPFGKSYLYIPHGPEIQLEHVVAGIKNEIDNFLKYLKDLAREEGAIFIKFEPINDIVVELFYRKGIRRSSKQIQPYKTVVLDLSLPEEHLLGKMHTKTRYNIKVAEKNGITVKVSNDFETFWELMGKTTKRDRFSSHSKEYYRKLISFFNNDGIKAELVMAYKDEKAVAGAIMMTYGDTCYYLHGASDHDYRAMMAPYALHWENIKLLKNKNIKYYDLWGIDAKKWPGVTRFKLGWGGDLKEYPGSFDLVVSRFWYYIYSIARKLF
jgi:peptidoglycan pentaglycine glycine transferase (the first glycine)